MTREDIKEIRNILVEEGQSNYKKYGFKLGDTIKFSPSQVKEILENHINAEIQEKECKHCDYFSSITNICLKTGLKCYEKKRLLHKDCKNYKEGSWYTE